MALRNLLNAERIAILAEPGSRAAVLDEAARLLARSDTGSSGTDPSGLAPAPGPGAKSPEPALIRAIGAGLHERERAASTAIGHGVAIPHARIEGIDQSRCAFLRLAAPVDFGAADGEPVDLVLALAEPAHHVQQHLELLAELAEILADPGYRSGLRNAPTIDLLRRRLLDGAGPTPSS